MKCQGLRGKHRQCSGRQGSMQGFLSQIFVAQKTAPRITDETVKLKCFCMEK